MPSQTILKIPSSFSRYFSKRQNPTNKTKQKQKLLLSKVLSMTTKATVTQSPTHIDIVERM